MHSDKKTAFITGITGQDGSYLAELLLSKGYKVYGLVRRTSNDPMERIDALRLHGDLELLEGNMRDLSTIRLAMEEAKPDEVYNLAAQSHVGTSFKCPDETWDINYFGLGRVLIEAMKVNPDVRLYQASTSEMFGNSPAPQNEQTPFAPVSPYAKAKLRAHEDFVVGYREKHDAHISSGILFNHESPRRGKQFVTRKITHSVAKIQHGTQQSLALGNVDAKRDWGFAGDYVEAMWQMLQQEKSDDYVIATNETHTVREFVERAFKEIQMTITWQGHGVEEVGVDEKGVVRVTIDPQFYRPHEVNHLKGETTKAKEKLQWKPKVSFHELVSMMVASDLEQIRKTLT